jgi:hypothetical protein
MENIPNVSNVFWNIHFVHLYMKLRKSKEVHLNFLYFVESTLNRLDIPHPSWQANRPTQPPVIGLCPGCETAGTCIRPPIPSRAEIMFGYHHTSIPPSVPPVACYVVIFTFTLNKWHYAWDPVSTREYVFLPKLARRYLSPIPMSDCETYFMFWLRLPKSRRLFSNCQSIIRNFDVICYCCSILLLMF